MTNRERERELNRYMSAQKGFTLIELLVVISIIAILSVIGITVFSGVQNSVRISSTKETLRRLQQAMIRYKINNGELPPTGDSCPACYPNNDDRANAMRTGPLTTLALSSNGGPYIASVEEFVYDPWGQAYWYDDNDALPANIPPVLPCQGGASTGNSLLYSTGPDKAPSGGDDIHFGIVCP